MQEIHPNLAAADQWYAKYEDRISTENVILEFRHTPGVDFLLHTVIRQVEYHLRAEKFMIVMEDLFSRLPRDASLTIIHNALLHQRNQDHLVQIHEKIISSGSGSNVSIVYAMRLSHDGQTFASGLSTESAVFPLYSLLAQMNERSYFKLCAFCHFHFEDDLYGGSDGHRDLMYCFRDIPDVLERIRSFPHKSRTFPRFLLQLALQDVDAFHSCSAFALRQDFDLHLDFARKTINSNC